MKFLIASQIAVTVAVMTGIVGLEDSAMGEAQTSQAQQVSGAESARSSPPDTTPYVRPVIPADRLWTPPPTQNSTSTRPQFQSPAHDHAPDQSNSR
jgi:hypothetical protein